jgi:hypothetical protein
MRLRILKRAGDGARGHARPAAESGKWERVLDALPERLETGPERRARLAIQWVVWSVADAIGATDARTRKTGAERIDRMLAGAFGRSWEMQATMMLVAQISVFAALNEKGSSPLRGLTYGTALRPETPIDPTLFLRAVEAWRENDLAERASGGRKRRRVNVWGPVASAIASAGLHPRSPTTLAREWRTWRARSRRAQRPTGPPEL